MNEYECNDHLDFKIKAQYGGGSTGIKSHFYKGLTINQQKSLTRRL